MGEVLRFTRRSDTFLVSRDLLRERLERFEVALETRAYEMGAISFFVGGLLVLGAQVAFVVGWTSLSALVLLWLTCALVKSIHGFVRAQAAVTRASNDLRALIPEA